MQQPIYWPDRSTWYPNTYEKAYETITLGHSENDVYSIFNKDDRVADYQYYPHDAIQSCLDVPDMGAQVSFSGCLIENVSSLAEAGWNGGRYAPDWYSDYIEARNWSTSGGNPRLDLVAFTYHHAIAPLLDENTFRKEIQIHKDIYPDTWGASPGYSNGYFPSETAFSMRLIKVLAEEGIDWAFVPNIHISRACEDYPYVSNLDNCDPPNQADQINPSQGFYYPITTDRGVTTRNAAPYAYQAHRAKYVDPETAQEYEIIVVPTAQGMGWEDGYECYGTGDIDAISGYNDPSYPMIVVLAHDGDNAFGGGYTYYNECVTNFVHSAQSQGYEPSTVEEYLQDHPPAPNDYVHVEDGAWINADGDFGSPQFINWNWPLTDQYGNFDIPGGWQVDARNWAVITAAQNMVETAEQIAGGVDISEIRKPSGSASDAELAWHFFLPSVTSGYMYYGSALDMEVKATLACNEAAYHAELVIGDGSQDQTPPSIWMPQRHPYNPGGTGMGSLWGYIPTPMDNDFYVWTFVHDVSGVAGVDLYYRLDNDGANPLSSNDNETYAGGDEVGDWQVIPMTFRDFPAENIFNYPDIDFTETPDYIADEYYCLVEGLNEVLVDYYVEATDSNGYVKRSPIQHVYVGPNTGGPGADTVAYWVPEEPQAGGMVDIYYDPIAGTLPDDTDPVYIHIGHSGWNEIITPDPQMTYDEPSGYWKYSYSIPVYASSVDFVTNDGTGNWDNNFGQDWHIIISSQGGFDMDGQLDVGAQLLAQNGRLSLWAKVSGDILYVATNAAGHGSDPHMGDHFIFITDGDHGYAGAPWGKSGQVSSWECYLADENDNDYEAWYDATGGAGAASGPTESDVLEGILNMAGEFGEVPSILYLAAAEYGNPDGGALILQVPEAQAPPDGNIDFSELYPFTISSTQVVSTRPSDLERISLALWPTPFTERISIDLYLAPGGLSTANSHTIVEVINVRGQIVATIFEGALGHGHHTFTWDGRNDAGNRCASGVYVLALRSGQTILTKKAMLLR
jgi:hypothetical protein